MDKAGEPMLPCLSCDIIIQAAIQKLLRGAALRLPFDLCLLPIVSRTGALSISIFRNGVTMKKIISRESIGFFIISLAVFLAGADFPPPAGFWIIGLILLVFTLIQARFLGWLVPRIRRERTFRQTMLFYLTSALVLAAPFFVPIDTLTQRFPWIILSLIAGFLFGTFVWLVHWLMMTRYQNQWQEK